LIVFVEDIGPIAKLGHAQYLFETLCVIDRAVPDAGVADLMRDHAGKFILAPNETYKLASYEYAPSDHRERVRVRQVRHDETHFDLIARNMFQNTVGNSLEVGVHRSVVYNAVVFLDAFGDRVAEVHFLLRRERILDPQIGHDGRRGAILPGRRHGEKRHGNN
jgi:hypothetical protein